jgi:allophanate hydrolase
VTETVAAIVAAHRAGTLSPAETVARSYRRIRLQ